MFACFDLRQLNAGSRRGLPFIMCFAFLFLTISVAAAQGTDKLRGGAYSLKTFYLTKPEALEDLPNLLRDGKFGRALKLINELISTIETDTQAPYAYHAYNALCVTQTAREDYEKALPACNKALTYRPHFWEAMNNRGAMHYANGNYEGARSDFEAAALTTPNSEAADLVSRNVTAAKSNIE
jgi:Flp pilus assembly protein TadD